jgi:hypothetical protein
LTLEPTSASQRSTPSLVSALWHVKVKIGNVVNHVPLSGGRGASTSSRKVIDGEDGAFKG